MDGSILRDPETLPSYRLEAKDFQAFLKYWARPKPGSAKKRNKLVNLAVTAALLAGAVYVFDGLVPIRWEPVLTYVVLPLIALVVLGFIFQRYQCRRAATMVAGEISVSLAEDGFHIGDDDTHTVVRWGAIEKIGQTADHIFVVYGAMKSAIIPKRIFDGPEAVEAAMDRLRARCPAAVSNDQAKTAQDRPEKRRKRRWGRVVGAIFLALAIVWIFKPWRDSIDLGDDLGSVSYLTVVSDGAGAATPLPLIIDLHPLGGSPELSLVVVKGRDLPVRTVMPAGPIWLGIGNSWFSFDDEMARDARESADRIAAFTRAMMKRHPTVGKPIVTGFSQGGSLSYALAAYHPELFAASVPVAGALPDSVPKRDQPPKIKVRALHGADDEIVLVNWAQHTVREMRDGGWDVTLKVYPDIGHGIGGGVKDDWRALLAGFAEAQHGDEPDN